MPPATEATIPPGHWRDGELAILDRSLPLPDCCVLTGAPARRRVRCLFHWQQSNFQAGHGPADTLLRGFIYYFRDIPKARLELPLSDRLVRRRRWAWIGTGLLVLAAGATIFGILEAQRRIDALPKGPERSALNAWLPPTIAAGGAAVVLGLMLAVYYSMPMLTVRLTPARITDTHVWLAGGASEWLRTLTPLDSNASGR